MTSVLTHDPTTEPGGARSSRVDRFRDAFHAGACVLSGLLIAAGSATALKLPDDASGAELLPLVEAEPVRHYVSSLCFGLGLVLLAAVGLAVLRLTRERGGVLGTIGGLCFVVGGVSAGAAVWAYGVVSTTLAEASGDLGTAYETLDDSGYVASAFLFGFPPIMLGFLVGGLALWRSRAVPTWAAALLALSVLAPIIGEDGVVGVLTALPMIVAFVAIAVALLRRGDRT